jgi:hypothetical protein
MTNLYADPSNVEDESVKQDEGRPESPKKSPQKKGSPAKKAQSPKKDKEKYEIQLIILIAPRHPARKRVPDSCNLKLTVLSSTLRIACLRRALRRDQARSCLFGWNLPRKRMHRIPHPLLQ